MQRRNLAKNIAASAAMLTVLPLAAQADMADPNENVVFTEADPGHWNAMETLHIPVVTLTGSTMTIKTPHPMSAPHYIVSHSVVLADGTFLSRQTFTHADQPVSVHTLPAGYTGKVTVTSTCNRHDFWVKTVSI